MDAAHGGFHDGEGHEGGHAADDGSDCAPGVAGLAVQAQHDGAEEGGFEAAEGEEVDPDQEVRRFEGCDEDQQADDGRDPGARPFQRGHGHPGGVALEPVVDVEVFDDGGGDQQEHGVDRGHDGRQGAGDEHARPYGGEQFEDHRRHGQVAGGEVRENGAAEGSGEVSAQDHEADEQGADDHGVVHGAGVPVAHAALGGVRQAQHADAHQDPEGQGEGLRHCVARPGGRDQAGVDVLERRDALRHAASGVDDGQQHHDHGHDHDHALDGVRQHHGAETADRRVQHHADAEQGKADGVGVARDGLEEARPADELRQHGGHEEDDQGHGAQDDHRVAVVAGAQVVGDGHGPRLARHDGEPFAEHPQREERRGHLDHRQQHPAQPEPVRDAGTADETAGAGVAGDDGHGEDKAPHGPAADEVFLDESLRGRLRRLLAGPQRNADGQGQVHDHGDNGLDRAGHHSFSPFIAGMSRTSASSGISLKNSRTTSQRRAVVSG